MDQIIEAAAHYYVFTMLGVCFVLGSIMKSITAIITSSSRERSRREIAAYIAEGSMSAEQGERLIRAEISRGSNANRAA